MDAHQMMTFPVVFHIFGHPIPAHAVFELTGYVVGVQTYLLIRKREKNPAQPIEASLWIIVCCVFGALIGSKVLAWLELSPNELASITDWRALLGGKTIVGGLLGGWIGVELGKKWFGIARRTGDAYVLPLVLGIAIGRVGCFLTGLPDHTYGNPTNLPWGVDFGDGIPRHPTQLYEIFFVVVLGMAIWLRSRKPWTEGELFRLFMLGYFTFRVAVEFIKPVYRPSGLSAIQGACVVGIVMTLYGLIERPTSATSFTEVKRGRAEPS
jgi:prolipoprotein diacylglyceryltransferase